MFKVIRCALVGGAVAIASAGLTQVTPVGLASALPAGCAPRTRTVVAQSGVPTYAAIGTAAGKYNSSNVRSTLHYTLSFSTSRSTSWTGTAKASVSWGIAQVEASTAYNVTKTTTKGVSVTDDVVVPAHYYGYDQPKVEYRRFHIYAQDLSASCAWTTSIDYGYLKAITTVPFFSSCTAASACTPKP